MSLRVGVLAPESSWHFRDLQRSNSMAANGQKVELVAVDFATLAASVGIEEIAPFSDFANSVQAMDAVIVRTMPKGSLQQIVFRMDLLHRLESAGIRIVNSPRSVEIAIDKYLSLALMADNGISIPAFAVCQTVEQGLDTFERMGRDAILKPIFGSMGKHVYRLSEISEARSLMQRFVDQGEVIYLQKFVRHGGSDIRILVVGEEIFSMRRIGPAGSWLTNIARGSTAERYRPNAKEVELARKAAKINRCEIAGIDIAYDNGSDDPLVLEVNASPGWEAIQNVCESDVANSVLKAVTTNLG
ncbi:ATP-grasp domain-containing protein [Mariniblastus fucicola]|uniref:Ribosomal protein S6 modification protein n=1 Tax=Mariniblastus fucicola TaxID=980251 RepID=A0A5B9P6L0_9BACT|nr:RimK family alpha-L-glutamate ligase [Mariniblastus fucicola]QEG21898.1 Ribosomal protein S6 modification protein [Mariniblastus fucicola]